MTIFFPVGGWILVKQLLNKRNIATLESKRNENTEYYKDNEKIYMPLNKVEFAKEVNFVPIQDALLLNDNKTKRKLIIHSIKENSIQNPELLKEALLNEDSETSHYAASALLEMNRNLLNSMQECAAKLDLEPNHGDCLLLYCDTIKKYITQNSHDEAIKNKYLLIFADVLERILESNLFSEQHFEDKIECELELKNFEKAKFYSDQFIEVFPLAEKAYVSALKLYYKCNNLQEMRSILQRFKKQPIHLSPQSMGIIRYWS